MTKVNITSMTAGEVSVFQPSIPFRMSWPAKGSVRPVEEDVIEQLMFTPGFRYMIETGILYIEDMEEKKKLGIEPEDAKEPVNVIVLKDSDMKKYWTMYDADTFKKAVKKLNLEQISNLADYAIKNEIADFEKSEFIKEISGKDVIKTIQLMRQNTKEE